MSLYDLEKSFPHEVLSSKTEGFVSKMSLLYLYIVIALSSPPSQADISSYCFKKQQKGLINPPQVNPLCSLECAWKGMRFVGLSLTS